MISLDGRFNFLVDVGRLPLPLLQEVAASSCRPLQLSVLPLSWNQFLVLMEKMLLTLSLHLDQS